MTKYLNKVAELITQINNSNQKFKKILSMSPNLTKESQINIENIVEVSEKYTSALNNFLSLKKSDKDVSNSEKSKIKVIYYYYKGMSRILSNYEF